MVAELATEIGLVKGVVRVAGTGMAIGAAGPAATWAAGLSCPSGSITCISTSTADMLLWLEFDGTLDTCGGSDTRVASIKTTFEPPAVDGSEVLLRVVGEASDG